ncbi:hypothetical protein EMIHUDRAFT_233205 [Emiliania huxleyi CCMP1516]|uniref:Uncharacterized protein n=2 Tax=Emiliania huxleyi TaxID=2903 RepID=A0A0D3K390_EMIH1|nr:hypothetical protein EMIHUDRAFT_233205 [Emiliania huxleyi CCMP1516]EOD30225.1 hypothetical protein EMIHUDRAFT_233205 [Emiliania huxleyi CCMP1516]|eukprot:XP_005782654.1 hypothetical protein EMIHUDRAFT_233205 [Emiliania huxleyi CCMP1516]
MICILAVVANPPSSTARQPASVPLFLRAPACTPEWTSGGRTTLFESQPANLSTEPPDAAIPRETLEAVIKGSDSVKHDARITFRHSTEALSAPPDLTVGPNKVEGQKRSKNAEKDEVLTPAGGSSAGVWQAPLIYLIAVLVLCGVASEASIMKYNATKPAAEINVLGRGTVPATLSVNMPESWPASAAGKARNTGGLVGAGALLLLGRVALPPSAAQVRLAVAALLLVLLAIACGAPGLLAASGKGARGAASSATVAAAAAALAVIGTVMWCRNSKARRPGWSSLLGILLCLATFSGGLVTVAGGAAFVASSTALPDVTAVTVGGGSYPSEVSWDLTCTGALRGSGGAPYFGTLSAPPGECTLDMHDSYGDGWNGDLWKGAGYTFTLDSGSYGSETPRWR